MGNQFWICLETLVKIPNKTVRHEKGVGEQAGITLEEEGAHHIRRHKRDSYDLVKDKQDRSVESHPNSPFFFHKILL